MGTPRTHYRNWDEFRWEQEIRRDERRINCYFRTLPSCLDLPGEEEMVNSAIAARGDLLPDPALRGNVITPWSYQSPDEDGEEHTLEERHRGEFLIDSLDKLASQWNLHCAITPEIQYAALSIACSYAKLLARCADFLDVPEENTSLQRCLGKRCLNDLLEVHTLLGMLGEKAPEEHAFTAFQQKRLIGLREQLSNFLAMCK